MNNYTFPSKKKIICTTIVTVFFIFSVLSGQTRNSVRITSPRNGERVGVRLVVKGTSAVRDNSHIWVLVHLRLLTDQWWPQPKPVVDAHGNWQALVYVGAPQDIGFDFEIAVASFSKDEERKILAYQDKGTQTGSWLPIRFPGTTSNIDIVTVRKISH